LLSSALTYCLDLGYYPNISPAQLKAVNELVALVEQNNLNINIDEEEEFLKLLRFLRARKFVVAKSFELLQKDVLWRLEDERLKIRGESASEALGCDVGRFIKYFPAWIQGVDKQARPVSYRQFGKFEIWNVLKETSMARLLRFHAWETEQALRLMYEKSADLNINLETFVVVIDAAGWKMKLATGDAYTFIKGMASTDSDHYPERLGMLIVINAPSMLSVAWKVVKGFLDDVTKAKIKIFSSNKKEWQPVLFNAIDQDQIPEMYGGTAPNPDLVDTMMSMGGGKAEADEEGEAEETAELAESLEAINMENEVTADESAAAAVEGDAESSA
jgi:hypothetical protein